MVHFGTELGHRVNEGRKEAVSFLKKSNQKTFVNLGQGRFHGLGQKESKSFCFFFFRKRRPYLPRLSHPLAT
jgi:hypothetical protein